MYARVYEYTSFLLSCDSKSVHVQVLSAKNYEWSSGSNSRITFYCHISDLYVHVPLGPLVSTLLQEQGKASNIR